ncbi:ArgE/DapE family deacylase [Roseovarius pelagicus]|uniref:ArgE/DapE family deacylase n=1 Tax=Roseovarius pelagicus TaxID=2980108 RepID=A0ABY6DCX5_9RHOB|nr:ArgE/DapE family deacylase [Roseovarius pelagicus]UXX81680.1 ArgE/DapE family deacylase [Roseovarius pelagicus]
MSLTPDLKSRILQAVEDGFDDQVAYLQKLVRLPSVRGQEHAIQDVVFREFQTRGLKVDRFDMDRDAIAAHPGGSPFSDTHSDAPIVVGIHHPRDEVGRSLILNAHLDVVPEGPREMWQADPYSAHIEGDWMYGRGAGDMKAGSGANLAALDALRRVGLRPAATVYVQSVVEEESTGNGALMTYLRGYTADAVLIPEPEAEMLVRANVGVVWFQVTVQGTPVHVAHMGEGANAIDAVYRVVGSLRELETAWNAQKDAHPHFADYDHPINLNIGKIAGGDWASSVPAWATIDCRVSLYPGQNAAEAMQIISDHVAAYAHSDPYMSNSPPTVTFNGFTAEGYVLEPGSEAEAVLGRAHEAAIGAPLQSFTATAYLDTRVYALYNQIPALCYGPISRNIHGYDESVSLSSLKRITGAMALFIAEWCGVEEV